LAWDMNAGVPIPYYSLSIPAAVIAFYLAYAVYHWEVGERGLAKRDIFSAVQVVAMIGIVWLLFIAANYVVSQVLGVGTSVEAAWRALDDAARKFDEIYRKCVDWILYIAWARGVLATVPYVSSLSDVLGSATLWETWAFSFASTTFLALKWLAVIMTYLHPWLLTFGAALTVSDRLRAVGGAMLAIYLVMGAALVLIANHAYSHTIESREFSDVDPFGAAVNPAEWPSVAARADGPANTAIYISVFAMVAMTMAGIVTAGISSALGSIAVMIRPV